MSDKENNPSNPEAEDDNQLVSIKGLYEDWFLDYASYVILERAVPAIEDGLKPVQRRIMHAMKEMDDGRFNKVANIIGQTMQYHPHGDASIKDAIVHLGQKDLLIETQGNWGDIRTGDSSAAPRYIEARLSKFALEVLFNKQTTDWQLSYDGRKNEPVTLPVKFPLLLAQGVEGIAVGLSTKILPHNFIELCEASIKLLEGKRVKLYPDFPTGGTIDISEYNNGKRGGRVKIRAKIEELDKSTLVIRDIPYNRTTTSLIDSIIKANDKGKIKIKKVVDNTAKEVEILITLASGQSPDVTIDALYAFTDCETSVSPNACVIEEDKPVFLTVEEILKNCTDQTVELLKRELEIRKQELLEKILFSSLEKIFIENRIYRDIEECETWDAVIETIDRGLDPFKPQFYRTITRDDITRLTEIKIKRISKFDSFKADEQMRNLQAELEKVEHHLSNIIEYTIDYFRNLIKKYGKGRERKTEISTFEKVNVVVVAANNAKLYVNRAEGFIGYGLKKDEYVCECSDLDNIIAFRKDGKCMVKKISDKVFMGKNIVHVEVFRKGDERKVYNMIYLDAKSGRTMVKRFSILGVTRDKEYDLTKKAPNSKMLYFTSNPNGEAEVVTIYLNQSCRARIKIFDYDFAAMEIKGRGSAGNILSRYPVRKIKLKHEGVSTLGGLKLWFDEAAGRLNKEERGYALGSFDGEDKILALYKDGSYQVTNFEISNRYDPQSIISVAKFEPEMVITAAHYDTTSKDFYLKRFNVETNTEDKRFVYINEDKGSKLLAATSEIGTTLKVKVNKAGDRKIEIEVIDTDTFMDVKGWKARGNKLSNHKVKSAEFILPAPQEIKEKQDEDTKNNDDKDNGNGYDVGSTIELF